MGACFITLKVSGTDEKKMKKAFEQAKQADRAQYGYDSYSGSWAVVPDVEIASYPKAVSRWTKKAEREAFGWLADNAEKWENALAIKTSTGWLIGAWAAS